MEKNNTKQEILIAALDLFSTQGFDATSMSQIAEAVGVRKASLYSHFASKDDILKSLMQNVLETYEKHSIFANADFDNPEFVKGNRTYKIHSSRPVCVERSQNADDRAVFQRRNGCNAD